MEAAVILALEDVNAATSVLPNTVLKRVVKDSACDPGLGMKAFIGKRVNSGVARRGGDDVGMMRGKDKLPVRPGSLKMEVAAVGRGREGGAYFVQRLHSVFGGGDRGDGLEEKWDGGGNDCRLG